MSTCARCGRNPIFEPGIASRLTDGRMLTAYFCHGQDTKDPSCYTLSMWANFPELQMVEA